MRAATKPVKRRDAAKAAEVPTAGCAFFNRFCLGRSLIILWNRLAPLSDFRTLTVATDRY